MAEDSPRPSRFAPASFQRPDLLVTIRVRPDRGAVVATVNGELDLFTAPHLHDEVSGCFAGGLPHVGDVSDARSAGSPAQVPQIVVFDLTGVTFLAAAGLRFIMAASMTASDHGQLLRVVTGDKGNTRRMLQITQLDTVLALFPRVEDALETDPNDTTPGYHSTPTQQ